MERSRTLRRHFASELVGVPVVLAVLMVGTGVVVGLVAILGSGDIRVSGWEAASQVARWYAGTVGVYATAVHLPLYIAHGFTRREFLGRLPLFLVGFAATFAVFMTLGYFLEGAIYDAFGWEHGLNESHLYATPDSYGPIWIEYALIGAVWSAAGTFIGGAFYRQPFLGLLLVPVAISMIGLVEVSAGPGYVGPFTLLGNWSLLESLSDDPTAGAATLATSVSVVAAMGLMWVVAKDLPIRTRKG
jgi:hypothetical protein